MTTDVTLSHVTYDEKYVEWVLYLVEDGPWPIKEQEWRRCLLRIQQNVLAAVDVAVDGHLAARYPESERRGVRIQVDSPSGSPKRLEELVEAIRRHLGSDREYARAIRESAFIRGLRLVTGKELGRFEHR